MYFLTPMCFICLHLKRDFNVINRDVLTKMLYCIGKAEDFILPVSHQTRICIDCLNELNAAFHFKKLCLKNINQFKNYIVQLGQASKNLEPCNALEIKLFDLKSQGISNNHINKTHGIVKIADLSLGDYSGQQFETAFIKEEILDEEFKEARGDHFTGIIHEDITVESTTAYFKLCPVEEIGDIFIKRETLDEMQSYTIQSNELKLPQPKVEILDDVHDEGKEHQFKEILEHNYCQYQKPPEIINNKSKLFFTCAICGKNYTLRKTLIRHIESHAKQTMQVHHVENKPYSCSACGKCFISKYLLKRHTKLTHVNERPFSCLICAKSFNYKSNLKKHMSLHSNVRQYSCSVCKKSFTHQEYLTKHMVFHINKQSYSCSVCTKRFNEKSYLNKHMLLHSDGPYSCSICKRTFTQKQDVERHTLTHSTEQALSCSICMKIFSNESRLDKHMLSHSAELPYPCSVCKKRFTEEAKLKRHVTIHSSERLLEYSCSICQKGFNYRSKLNIHMLSHSNERPHICTECMKGFTQKCNLKSHMLTHTNKQQSHSLQKKQILP